MGFKYIGFAFAAVLFVQGFTDAKHINSIEHTTQFSELIEETNAEIDEVRTQLQEIATALKNGIEEDGGKPKEGTITRSIIGDIIKLIEKVKRIIADIINKGVDSIKDAFDQIRAVASKLITKFTEKIKELLEKLRQEIEEIKSKAQVIGVDISECMEQMEPRIATLNREVSDGMNECVANVVDSAKQIYERILIVRNDIVDEFHALVEQFHDCKDFDCRLNLLPNFAQLSRRAAVETKDLIVKSIAEIAGSTGGLGKCTAYSGLEYAKGIKAIRKEFQKCYESIQQTAN